MSGQHYRDGDVVRNRRNTSPVRQARSKNPDTAGSIGRRTKHRNIDNAALDDLAVHGPILGARFRF